MNSDVLRSGLSGDQKYGNSIWVLHYCTFRLETANDAQNVRVGTARRKDNDQQNLLQIIM